MLAIYVANCYRSNVLYEKEAIHMQAQSHSKQVALRIPSELKEWVQNRAERAERSMNWVIVKLIEKAKQEEEARQ